MMKPLFYLFALLFSLSVQATENRWVRDDAAVLTPEQRQELTQLLDEVQARTSAEVMVITVTSLDGEYIDDYATHLFNQIRIGKQGTNNGVLFLIAPNERSTRIEVGYGLEPLLTDSLAGEILDDYVIPRFRNERMGAGILEGTRAIVELLERYPDAARGLPNSTPIYLRTGRSDLTLMLWLMAACAVGMLLLQFYIRRQKQFPSIQLYLLLALCGSVAVAAAMVWYAQRFSPTVPLLQIAATGLIWMIGLILNLRLFRRYGPHRCKACGGPMQLLSEQLEDPYLIDVQLLEEKLKSVDYDVWRCPACLKAEAHRYLQMFRDYRTCPECRAETFQEQYTTLVEATYDHGGQLQIDGNCESCHHHTSRIRNTPRLSRSSDSSGHSGGSSGSSHSSGGSGGGMSGGGGASRSW